MQKAKPFLKWVGGKNQLLSQFDDLFPAELKNGSIKNYIEPFLGGGAVFFFISGKYSFKNAYLTDSNSDLILSYKVIQKKTAVLLEYLHDYQEKYIKTKEDKRNELFYFVRKNFNEQRFNIDYKKFSDNWAARAAQLIFLNKTCFNGLYRLNSKGEFNVPVGKHKTISIYDEENILAVSKALQNAEIINAEYDYCQKFADENSFIYFDPPYRPLNKTADFTAYTGIEFNDKQQMELAHFFRKLDNEKGSFLMLSNSDPANTNPHDDFFEKAYSGYNIHKVSANRAVNCKGAGRGKVGELVITNY